MPLGGEGSFESFLEELWKESGQREAEDALNSDEAVKQEETKGSCCKKLFDTIEEGDPQEVYELLKSGEFENVPHLKDLNEVSKSIAGTEGKKDCFCKFICSELKDFCKNPRKNNGKEDLPSEEDRLNLEIRSNPLFLSLEWLWRNNPESSQREENEKGKDRNFEDVTEPAHDDAFSLEKMAPHKNHVSHDKYIDREEECEKPAIDNVEQVNDKKELLHKDMDIEMKARGKREKGKESKLKDVIEAALDDAFLLEKMASYENPFSHDKYMDHAEEREKFAIDIIEQVNGNKELLHIVMDIDGEGALVKNKSDNFICSLSLLKMAANKERKMVSEW